MNARLPVEGTLLVCLTLGLATSALAQTPGSAGLNPLAALPAEATSAFTERPLFSESRRPVARLVMPTLVAAPPAPPSAPTTADLRLIGIVQTAQGTLARILVAGSGEAQAVRSGEAVSGWTVTAITPSAVALKQGEHVASLALFTPGAGVQAPSAVYPAPAAGAVPNPTAASPARVAPMPPANGGAAPPGTVPGTAAADAAANAPFALTFGGTPQ